MTQILSCQVEQKLGKTISSVQIIKMSCPWRFIKDYPRHFVNIEILKRYGTNEQSSKVGLQPYERLGCYVLQNCNYIYSHLLLMKEN